MRTFATAFFAALLATAAPAPQSAAAAANPVLSAPDPEPSPAALIARAKPLKALALLMEAVPGEK